MNASQITRIHNINAEIATIINRNLIVQNKYI